MTGFDTLEAEDRAFEKADDPNFKLEEEEEEIEQEVDEELAEELKLAKVTTEPGTMTEETEALPAGEDGRRAQTTA